MKREITLDYLDYSLCRASRLLDNCACLARDLEFNSKENIKRIAEALVQIFDIQNEIYDARPDLMPEWLKPGAKVRGHG